MAAKQLMISILLVGLFFVSIVNFGILLQDENGATNNLRDDPRINSSLGSIITELEGNDNLAQTQKDVFQSEDPQTEGGGLTVKSIFGIWTIFTGMLSGVYNIIGGVIFGSIFGNTFSVVASVILTIFTAMIILAGWQLLRTGGS